MTAFFSGLVNVIMASLMLFCALSPISRLSIMASVLILAVIAVRLLCRRIIPRNVMFVLWIVVIARLLIPFTLTTPVSIFNTYEPFGIRYDGDFPYRDVKLEPALDESPEVEVEGVMSTEPTDDSDLRHHPVAVALRVGVPLALSSILVGYVIVFRRLKRARRINDERVLRIIGKMKYSDRVSLVTWEGNDTIMIFGIFKPTVILPYDYDDIDDRSLRYLLMHEMEHYYHGDGAWNLLMLIACFVHWFNPLVWIARRLFLNDMETACDERVLRCLGNDDKVHFAETLVDFAARSIRKKPMIVMAFGKNNIRDRVRRITCFKRAGRAVITISSAVVLAVALVFSTGAVNVFDSEDFVSEEWVSIYEYTMREDGELLTRISLLEDVYKLQGLPENSYLRRVSRWFTGGGESSLIINKNAPLPILNLPVEKITVEINGETIELSDSKIEKFVSMVKENENGYADVASKERYGFNVYFDVRCELVWNLTAEEAAEGRLFVSYNTQSGTVTLEVTELIGYLFEE